ncbi:hypothetical protein [Shinella sumterensis]|jgi:hypothetical protein|uniref:Uncharacterized protein n=1 Tax=Shinella sumterensis TaxID=1967501 RepID=A0AA50CSV5_9HYPH|nr:hypothetical protein [Shinella sumterensis]WLS01456.1 hypothetical protein Q9313_28520 [Shinella sumterensis]
MTPDTFADTQHILVPALEQSITAVVLIDQHDSITSFNHTPLVDELNRAWKAPSNLASSAYAKAE